MVLLQLYFVDDVLIQSVLAVILGCSCALIGLMPLHDARFYNELNSEFIINININIVIVIVLSFASLLNCTSSFSESYSHATFQPLRGDTQSVCMEADWLAARLSQRRIALSVDVPAHTRSSSLHKH